MSETEVLTRRASRRVLVVDDDVVVRAELLRLLRGEPGLTASGAANGDAARLAARSSAVDVVVLDLLLEGANEMLMAALSPNSSPPLPVIGMSARGVPSLEEGRALGCAAVISKPFSDDMLLRTIHEILDGVPA